MKKLFSTFLFSTALGTSVLFAQDFNVPVDGIPGGLTINVQPDGALRGTIEERTTVTGFPDEVDFTEYDAQINPDGSITGRFEGTDTFNVNDGNGNIFSQTVPYSGDVTGTIDNNGNYTVNWTGPDPGSLSGTLSGFSLPSGTIGEGITGGVEREYSYSGNDDVNHESTAEEVAKRIFGDIPVRQAAIVLKKIDDTANFCRLLDSPYRVDCMADRFSFIARTLPREEGGAEAAAAFKEASNKLRQVVRENVDTEAKRIMPRVRTEGLNVGSGRRLQAVKAEAAASVNAQALDIVTELSTVLLRSAENSEKRQRYYSLMAQAVDSNKVLLRS